MILAIAERVYDPSIPDERVRRWREAWMRDRLSCIWHTPAMTKGSTLGRLKSLIGVNPQRVVNLMWPDNRIGTWDKIEAKCSAQELRTWFQQTNGMFVPDHASSIQQYTGIVLLGLRVIDAFSIQSRTHWGEIADYDDGLPPVLLMPHPSGRNRIFNDLVFRRRLRRSAVLFAKLAEV